MKRSKNELVLIFSALSQVALFVAIAMYPAKEPILHEPVDLIAVILILCLFGTFFPYLYGFVKTIEEKGYPKIMNLLVFTGIIGFIVALAIEKKESEPGSGGNG